MKQTTLQRASKDYLNSITRDKERADGYNSLPLVVFPYRLGMRRVLGIGLGMVSLVVPDACICLLVGKQINNPVSVRYRLRVRVSDIKRFGLVLVVGSGYHPVRVKIKRRVRRVKAYYSSIFG